MDSLPEAYYIQGVNLIAEIERATKDGKKDTSPFTCDT